MENRELLEKAKQANSPEELLALAKENDYPLDEESAKAYFEKIHKSGELSDDELGSVAGGGCHTNDGRLVVTRGYGCFEWRCKKCGCSVNQFRSDGRDGLCSGRHENSGKCMACKFMSYESGLWLCNHKKNMK